MSAARDFFSISQIWRLACILITSPNLEETQNNIARMAKAPRPLIYGFPKIEIQLLLDNLYGINL